VSTLTVLFTQYIWRIFGLAGTSAGVGGSGNIRSNTKDKENYIALRKVVFINCFPTQIQK
jgi:hypothetical protein